MCWFDVVSAGKETGVFCSRFQQSLVYMTLVFLCLHNIVQLFTSFYHYAVKSSKLISKQHSDVNFSEVVEKRKNELL